MTLFEYDELSTILDVLMINVCIYIYIAVLLVASSTIQDAQERGEEIRMVVTQPRQCHDFHGDSVNSNILEVSHRQPQVATGIHRYPIVAVLLTASADSYIKCQNIKETAQEKTQKMERKGH